MADESDRFSKSWLLKRRDMHRINWDLPGAEREGFLRGMHNGVQARRAFSKLVTIPFGQKTPPHAVSADHMIFQVRGQVEFTLPDGTFRLDEQDLFFFPANARYSFENVGSGDAVFLSVVSESNDGWPPESEYCVA